VSNWNAYKIFKNGKRAKTPITTFEADKKEFFFSDVLPTLDKKLQNAEWVVIPEDAPQERPAEIRNEKEDMFAKKRNNLLSKLVAQKFPALSQSSSITCLMCNEDTRTQNGNGLGVLPKEEHTGLSGVYLINSKLERRLSHGWKIRLAFSAQTRRPSKTNEEEHDKYA
jgi:hypothetical protein